MKKKKCNYTVQEWNDFGLLEPVKEKDKKAIVKLFNKALGIGVLRKPYHNSFGNKVAFDITTLVFPTIIRIYLKSGITKINIEELYNELDEHFNKYYTDMLEMCVIGADGEAELLCMFTENYVNK